MTNTRFEAVLFDVGQTLVRVEPSVGQVYADVARAHGVDAVPEAIEQTFRAFWREKRLTFPDNSGYSTSEEIERAWWREAVEWVFHSLGHLEAFGPGFEAYFEDLFERFAHPEIWRLYEDVVPALDALERQGLRLAVVSNWDQRLYVLLDRLGLTPRFEFVLASARVGWRKPDPRIFQEALRRLELPPERVAHIGDSHEEDIVGAQGVGITPLHLLRPETTLASLSSFIILNS